MTNSQKRKILIAEDTPIQAKKLCYYLEKIGYHVDWAVNGVVAIQKLKESEYDLIISDVQMPEMNGLELVKKIRETQEWVHLPIIVVTTLEEVDVKIEALREGANDFLNKPYSIEELEIRSKNQIALYHYQKLIETENVHLNKELLQKNLQLEANYKVLEETHEQMKKMQEELVRVGKMTTLGLLGAGVAHEINNPLSIIYGLNQKMTKLIKMGAADIDGMHKCVESIDSNVKRINGIIKQLRRVSGGTESSQSFVPVSLNQFLKEIEIMFTGTLASSNVKFEKQYFDSDEIICIMNESNFTQALLNIIQNAVDAMSDQEEKKISIETRSDEKFVFIDIKDNGPGIPKDIQDKIFDPFFTTKDPNKGTGLGLSLCHTYLNEMGGGITFKSDKAGTVFTIYLPNASEGKKVSNG